MTSKTILQVAVASGVLSIIIGAFGAHKLKPVLTDVMFNAYEKGVQYQFYHTIALICVALLIKNFPEVNFGYVAAFFIAGIVLFSGSLYGLVLTSINGVPLKFFGPITPIGGLCFIMGWVMLFISVSKIK